jgi:hypothetical protein
MEPRNEKVVVLEKTSRSELTHEQEVALTHPAPLTDAIARAIRERLSSLEQRAATEKE